MSVEQNLYSYIGKDGVELLKSKSKNNTQSLLDSALVVAKCVHLKSLLEGCTKLNYKIPSTDIKVDISKTEDKWNGGISVSNKEYKVTNLNNDSVCSTVLTFSKSQADDNIVNNEDFINTVKTLMKSYKPKTTSLLLKKTEFECITCKSELNLSSNKVDLCDCFLPLSKSDVTINKINDKTKVTFNNNWNRTQVQQLLKAVTKSLNNEYQPKKG